MLHSAPAVRILRAALLVAGLAGLPAGTVHAEPADPPDVPSADAAVAFVRSVNEFTASLGDELLVYASSVFFKDAASYAMAVELKSEKLRRIYGMTFRWVARKGLRYILHPATPVPEGLPPALIVNYVDGIFRIDLVGSYRYSEPPPPDVDPQNQFPTLADALVGVQGEGSLVAILHFGRDADIRCRLLPDEAPATVATFVALARGLRSVRSEKLVPGLKDPQISWAKRPWYNGSTGSPVFGRRVLRLEGSEPPGFFIEDEFSVRRRHDKPALLTTIPGSPDMWDGAIGITTTPVSELDDVGTIFGLCDEAVVQKLARIWSVNKGEPYIPPLVGISIVRE